MHEFACKTNLIPVAQKHTVKVLLGHMNQLCKLDAQVKGAARSKRTLVELAVLSLAAA
jgi:DNA polymerase III delta subunit